jgi:hypothetical protein
MFAESFIYFNLVIHFNNSTMKEYFTYKFIYLRFVYFQFDLYTQ